MRLRPEPWGRSVGKASGPGCWWLSVYCPLGFWQSFRTRCKVSKVGFTDLEIGSDTVPADVPFFTRRQANLIIEAAREPFKTLFAVAWCTGLPAGEILALTLDDLDFTCRTVRVNKSSDDRTREIRQPKTEKSVAVFPMNTSLEAKLREYIHSYWKPNPRQILFPNRTGDRPRSAPTWYGSD